jgi:hypothetical protein
VNGALCTALKSLLLLIRSVSRSSVINTLHSAWSGAQGKLVELAESARGEIASARRRAEQVLAPPTMRLNFRYHSPKYWSFPSGA